MMYVLVGLASGIISGMGIGGGAILIPALTIFLDTAQQQAQHINLLYFVPTAIFALFVHKKEGNIDAKGLLPLAACAIPAAIGGALIAVKLHPGFLRRGFAIFLLFMAAYEITKGVKAWKQAKAAK
jgi:uncharacterized membrane protein YfcA